MNSLPFIVDTHLDLAMNAMEWNRDLTLPISSIRDREKGLTDKPDRGRGMVSLPALREGNIGLVVATQIARYVAVENQLPGWHSPEQAWAQSQGQLAWYHEMVRAGEMTQIFSRADLDQHLLKWNTQTGKRSPIGFVLSLEGADSLVTIDHLHIAYEYGLRAVGPAHYGPGRYCPGTGDAGPFTAAGLALLREMSKLRMILDVTHLTDEAFKQALELYDGPIWASHHNCRAIVPGQRQLTDEQIKLLIERGAIIGGVLDAWMLDAKWERGVSNPRTDNICLKKLVDHIQHICNIAGNDQHVCIGSDLDGAFGSEQAPFDMQDIASLQLLQAELRQAGFTDAAVKNVLNANALRFLQDALPQ
jgi:membrane dipeptidase